MKTPLFILILGVTFVFSLWLLANSGAIPGVKTDELEPLFTGLGFVGLLATFWHERAKSHEAEREHVAVLSEMRRNTAMSTRANQIAILSARITCLSYQIAEVSPEAKRMGDGRLSSERWRLIQELAKLGEAEDRRE